MINGDFGLDTEGKSKTRLLGELNEFLIDQYSKKSQPGKTASNNTCRAAGAEKDPHAT
jgi:hypothetical protein